MVTRRDAFAAIGGTALAAGVMEIAEAHAANTRRRATYVLVHGAGGGGWSWRLLAPYLLRAGHTVYAPSLTGAGERWHLLRSDTGLDTHIADIVELLRWEDLTDVILVGHSYGGMVITGVADRALDRIQQLVFLDAAHPVNGQSLEDVAPAVVAYGRTTLRRIDGIEVLGTPGFEAQARHPAGPALPPKGADAAARQSWNDQHTTPFPLLAITQKLQLQSEAAVRRIPRTNVNTTQSLRMTTDETSRRMQLDAARVWQVDTTHNLMITEPEKVADMLLRLAAIA